MTNSIGILHTVHSRRIFWHAKGWREKKAPCIGRGCLREGKPSYYAHNNRQNFKSPTGTTTPTFNVLNLQAYVSFRRHALKVYKVKHKTTGKYFACKSIKIKSGDEHERKQLMEEIKLIKMLDHPNTIKVIEVFQTRRELQIVMEMCTGGELFDRLYEQPQNHFSEDNCKRLFKQMLKSLSYIHANQIFHRDIKLENFLFTDKSVQSDIKLIDFGFSKEFDHLGKVFHQFVGTCYYMAPEVFKRNYGMEADMWSIAVVCAFKIPNKREPRRP